MTVAAHAPPLSVRLTPWRWTRKNLFGTWHNAALTILVAALGVWALRGALRFVFSSGRWDIVRVNLTGLLVGFFPRDQLWRVWVAAFVVATAAGFVAGLPRTRGPLHTGRPLRRVAVDIWRRAWPLVALVAVLVGFAPSVAGVLVLLGIGAAAWAAWAAGTVVPLRLVRHASLGALAWVGAGFWLVVGGAGWDRWGGLLLTLFLATAGIALSFPIGVLLALGRRSQLPAVRGASIAYIELIRGVPLVALLFMGSFVVGFLFPPGAGRPSLVTRALIAIVAFTAAYIAEIVRGGLQSVPKAQHDAALALGLQPIGAMRLVVLPQALRAVIPAIVGQFISLFKDTSLVAIIGLSELLRFAQSLTSQPEFIAQGLQAEVLVFVSFVYWVGSYSMSRESRRLERRLGVGQR